MKRVRGVRDAHFSYEQGLGHVTYDLRVTAPTTFIATLRELTGFAATVRVGPNGDTVGSTQEPEEIER